MPLASGTRLGPYEVLGPIGAGGMGEVYRARDTALGREVAIKVLPAAFAQDPERVARFHREAQLLAAFNHPNIASIHGLVEHDGALALALELVEGEDLHQRLRSGPIPLEEARAIGRQIAEGLEAAHEKGIVHRDLKPANIKVTPDGHVKVLDFGLAKAFDASAEPSDVSTQILANSPTMSWKATEAGIILGTAAYMSPEQARGKTVDKRSDIWAFGVVLFEMLSGRRLFTGETPSDTLAAVLRQEIDWSLLPKDVPPTERRLIERCLERDAKKRLRDIGEARIALDPTSASTSVVAMAALASGPSAPSALTRRSWLGIAGAGLGGVAVGFGFGRGLRTQEAVRPLTSTPITASGNVIEAAISPDGRYVAYVESEQGLQSLWLKQLSGGQTLRLSADANVAFWGHTFSPDGNSILYGQKSASDPAGGIYQISTLGGTPKRLIGNMDSQVTFAPDGRRLAFIRPNDPAPDESSLMIADADGRNEKRLASFKEPDRISGIFFNAPAWSPDGGTIVTSVYRLGQVQGAETRSRLVRIDANTGAVSPLADPGWLFAAHSVFRPDGQSLIVIARTNEQTNAQIWTVRFPDGAARPITSDLNDHRILSLTRDGQTLVSVSGNVASTIVTTPLTGSARPQRVSRARMDGLAGVAFTKDGSLVFSSYVAGVMSIWRAAADGSARTSLVTLDPGDEVFSIHTGEDDSLFFAVRTRAGIAIRQAAADGSSVRTLVDDARFDHIALLPESRSLVYTRQVAGIPRLFVQPTASGPARPLLDGIAFTPAVDPAGKRVAFYRIVGKGEFRVQVASIETGAILNDLPADPPTTASKLILRAEGIYINTVPGDRANVWLLPLDGKAPRKITSYDEQLVFEFAISDDGPRLAVVRGPRVRDAHLITGF